METNPLLDDLGVPKLIMDGYLGGSPFDPVANMQSMYDEALAHTLGDGLVEWIVCEIVETTQGVQIRSRVLDIILDKLLTGITQIAGVRLEIKKRFELGGIIHGGG